jgi:hypothetical protein
MAGVAQPPAAEKIQAAQEKLSNGQSTNLEPRQRVVPMKNRLHFVGYEKQDCFAPEENRDKLQTLATTK